MDFNLDYSVEALDFSWQGEGPGRDKNSLVRAMDLR